MTDQTTRIPKDVLTELHPDAFGRPLLIVNVASQCGFTKQYSGLEALHRRYSPEGLLVLGVPCNQFGGQEPGTDMEIQEFCQLNWGVTFPVLPRGDVIGPDRLPIYGFLSQGTDEAGESGEVRWNFEKFLVDSEGLMVGRFRPHTEPDDPAVVAAITTLLAADTKTA
jgi:glutathione peroxidase